jgi:hypothetical protein
VRAGRIGGGLRGAGAERQDNCLGGPADGVAGQGDAGSDLVALMV